MLNCLAFEYDQVAMVNHMSLALVDAPFRSWSVPRLRFARLNSPPGTWAVLEWRPAQHLAARVMPSSSEAVTTTWHA